MCGVFGFIANDGHQVNLKRLEAIAVATQRRGPHAFGFAWIDQRGRLRMYKQTGRISDHLGLLAMAADARMIVGHCRWATQGDPANNLNNHPHAADGGWIVHNGVIRDYQELCDHHDLAMNTDCDSEVLGLMVERFEGTLAQRCAEAVGQVDSPAVLLGLWSKPARMIAVRSGNPLMMGTAETGIYLGSLRQGLPADAKEVADGTTLEFRINTKGRAYATRHETAPETEAEDAGEETRSGTDQAGHATQAGAGCGQADLFGSGDGCGDEGAVHARDARPFAIARRRAYGF